jgi:hypothetical protein
VDRHTAVFLAAGPLHEASVDELVDQACDVRRWVEHSLDNLTPRVSLRMHSPKDPEHIVVSKLEIEFIAGRLHAPPHVGCGYEEIQHRLLRPALERGTLLDAVSEDLSHLFSLDVIDFRMW